jgi:hypothetical protein
VTTQPKEIEEIAFLLGERAKLMRFELPSSHDPALTCTNTSLETEGKLVHNIFPIGYDSDLYGQEMFWNLVAHRKNLIDARLSELGVTFAG